ncbi:hypothetical protein ABGV49_21535 [Chromobacterium vaccinii]|uniref:Uncharacterized protein n=1 Tax=Chromobacterium vaccinii TaxID=1108595 RepID=A0ABV0FHT0_9NEIS
MNRNDRTELSKITIEKEFEKAKGELTLLIADTKVELIQAVADAKVHIGETAIDKMHTINGHLKNWVVGVMITGTVAVLGLCGLSYSSISSTAQKYIETKLDDWMSLEAKGSILKESLGQVRMEAVLNALTIRLEKAKLDGRSGLGFDISEAEKARVIAYMQEPTTSIFAFRDGANILGALMGPFGGHRPNPKVDELLKEVFTTKNYQDEKRDILLSTLWNYIGVYPYATQVIDDKDAPPNWRADAFHNISIFNDKKAYDFANNNILKDENNFIQIELAKYLARRSERSKELDGWFKTPGKEDISLKYAIALNSASNKLINSLDTINGKKAAINQAVSYLYGIISTGGKIKICGDAQRPEEICVEKMNSIITVNNPRYLFGNDEIISELLYLSLKNNKTPEWLIGAITSKSKLGTSLALRYDIGQATLTGEAYGAINTNSCASSLMLVEDNVDGKIGVFARFRKPDGQWVSDRIIKFENFHAGKPHFSYDEDMINRMERREYSKRENSII